MVFGGGAVHGEQRRRQNLAPEHSSFVGRAAVLTELEALLDRSRVVTVVGPGGVGKTRVAKEIARERAAELDAIAFVDLSGAVDADDVLRALAIALDLRLGDERAEEIGAMIDVLGRALILLDNFEHLIGAARELVELFARKCGRAKILVTSRQPIGIEGEEVYRLEPLRPNEAMALFESRARMIRHDFAVQAHNRALIAAIVEELDHLPLAIELAAARMGVMSPEALLARLGERFELLADVTAPLDQRQATLHNTIAWSWQLLSPWERSALAQCSIFRGGFDLSAAEQILDLSEHPVAPKLIDVVQSLKTKSMIHSHSPAAFPNEVRFDLYESVRMFAWDMIAATGHLDHLAAQHARRYLAVSRAWIDAVDTSAEARARADLELENLLAAQRRTEETLPELSAQIGLALDRLLPGRAPHRLRRAVLDRAVAAAERASEDPVLLAKMLFARGNFERMLAPTEDALRDIARAESIAIERGQKTLEAEAIFARAKIAADRGELDLAASGYRRAHAIFAAEGARRQEAEVVGCLGNVCFLRGQLDEAQSFFERALELCRRTDHVRAEGITLSNLAALYEEKGNLGQARACYARASEIHRRVGNLRSEGIVRANLGNLLRREARFDEAKEAYREALAIHRQVRNRRSEAIVLGCLGALAIEEENFDAARAWLDAAIELAREVGANRSACVDRIRLAIVDHLEGDLIRAKDGLIRAAEDLDAIGDPRHAALARGHLGAVLAELDAVEDAERALESARTTLLVLSDAQLASAIEILEASLEVARFAIASLDRLLVERSVPAAEARIAELVIKRMLLRAREKLAHREALTIGPEARWFRIAEQEVSLERRRHLRLMVDALARLRTEQPGAGLTVHELFERGWPGVMLTEESSAQQVHVAIAELRRLGLGDVLVNRDDGYLFDPNVRLIRG